MKSTVFKTWVKLGVGMHGIVGFGERVRGGVFRPLCGLVALGMSFFGRVLWSSGFAGPRDRKTKGNRKCWGGMNEWLKPLATIARRSGEDQDRCLGAMRSAWCCEGALRLWVACGERIGRKPDGTGSGRAGFAAAIVCALAATAFADEPVKVEPFAWPDAPSGAVALMGAEYLSAEEAKDKRVFFGRYGLGDLDSPARAARAALVRGVYDDPSFEHEGVDALDRAEAMVMRGATAEGLALLKDRKEVRASRLRALALEMQGEYDAAAAEADATLARLGGAGLKDPVEIVEGVRLIAQRVRIKGAMAPGVGGAGGGGGEAQDYKSLMQTLGRVRTELDRFSWPALVAEAELLYAKDNRPAAAEAASQALALNPTCARAWYLLGRMTVDGFQFEKTEQIAKRLEMLDGEFDPEHADDGEGSGKSPWGGMLVARMLMRQSEGAQAERALAASAARYPRMMELRALRCAAEAVAFDFDASSKCLKEMDGTFGKVMDGWYEAGRALAESRQYGPGGEHLDEAHKRLPHAPEPLIDLGLMCVQIGADERARDALEKAVALDPFNVRADNSLRLVRELLTYGRVESEHYVVRYKPAGGVGGAETGGEFAMLAAEMIAPLEENHRIVTGSQPGGIDHVPKSKTLIDLMPDHQWFAVRIAGMPKIHTIAASTGPLIAMESPREGPKNSGTYDWVRVVRHEYVHTVTLSRTNNRIPHWFTEAAAVYLELAPRDYQTCRLLTRAHETGGLFDFEQINIAFVRPRQPSDRSQAYAQGHWMYEYIVEKYGARAPLNLMDKYAVGVREEDAFEQVLGVTRARFMEEFKAWAAGELRAWGMSVPVGMPTLRQLLAREAIKEGRLPEGVEQDSDEAKQHRRALELIAAGKSADANDPAEAALDLESVELPEPTAAMVSAWRTELPAHPDVLELAVDQYVAASGNVITAEAAELLEKYAMARPVDPKPHRLLAKMYLDEAASDPGTLGAQAAKAIPHLEYLDAREQKTPVYAMELARRYAAIEDMTKAGAKAERATQIAPFDARPRELAATIAVQTRDVKTAERHITALTVLEPTREIHRRRLEAVRRMGEGR